MCDFIWLYERARVVRVEKKGRQNILSENGFLIEQDERVLLLVSVREQQK